MEEESPAGVRAMSWAAESGVLTQQLQRNALGSRVFGLVGKKGKKNPAGKFSGKRATKT